MEQNGIRIEQPRYWMYNAVSDNSRVWQYCLENSCAIMISMKERDNIEDTIYQEGLKVNVGDYLVAYLSPKKITALGKVTKAIYEEVDEDNSLNQGMNFNNKEKVENYSYRLDVEWYKGVREPIKIDRFEDFLSDVSSKDKAEWAISKLEEGGFRNAERIIDLMIGKCSEQDMREGGDGMPTLQKVKIPKVSFDQEIYIKGLYFEDEDMIKSQIKKALKNGKSIILIGPTGTGKSNLAKEICKSYGVGYKVSTGKSELSTYDNIGGDNGEGEEEFYNKYGKFLNSIRDKENNVPLNKWLIIDDMNYIEIEKTVGLFFWILDGNEIILKHKEKSYNNVIIRSQVKNEEYILPSDFEYIIPRDWRIIGTMNTYDKSTLYEMSHSLSSRFAFIPVSVPRVINRRLAQNYLNLWGIIDRGYNDVPLVEGISKIWSVINTYRVIGPAIIKDIAEYMNEGGDYTSAIMHYVIPQFDGIMEYKIVKFVEELCSGDTEEFINKERLKSFVEDFFSLDLNW